MIRYSIIREKNPREILLLRGTGCRWKKCSFCDYHFDCSPNEEENLEINRAALSCVTGEYGRLEVINSGSFPELGKAFLLELASVCREKEIRVLHFECHYRYRREAAQWRKVFAGFGTELKIKTGVESFDADFRENVLRKGISESDPQKIAECFDECCLLFGIHGQTAESMRSDIETGLAHFERVCVNIFVENSCDIRPDPAVIAEFKKHIMPVYKDNARVDILLDNTDFGVGKTEENE
ncbi:MAG: radical SAM protein [Clostridiales bacterium]|nr:radical SAM protein [Clostridiales bacterium]